MPNKPTDAEIKKALKTLLELVLVEGCLQRAKTISVALDLINRQEAEIVVSQRRIATLEKLAEHRKKAVFERVERNLELRKDLKNANAENENLKAEVESLKEEVKKEQLYNLRMTAYSVKAEAYKECFEKAKSIVREMVDIMFDDNESKCRIDNCRYTSNVACGNEVCLTENRAFWNSKLDNLLNELVGDGDA